jgi:hypothetical protein
MYPWHSLFYQIQSPIVDHAYKLIQRQSMVRPISPNIMAIDVLTTETEHCSLLGDEVLYSGTSVPIFKRILLPPQTTLMTQVAGYSETSVHF